MKILFVNCLPKKNLFIVFTLIWAISCSSVLFRIWECSSGICHLLMPMDPLPMLKYRETLRVLTNHVPLVIKFKLNSEWFLKKVLYFLYFFGFTFSCNWFRWYKTNRELCVFILVLREKAHSKNLAILLINVIKSNSKLEKVYTTLTFLSRYTQTVRPEKNCSSDKVENH